MVGTTIDGVAVSLISSGQHLYGRTHHGSAGGTYASSLAGLMGPGQLLGGRVGSASHKNPQDLASGGGHVSQRFLPGVAVGVLPITLFRSHCLVHCWLTPVVGEKYWVEREEKALTPSSQQNRNQRVLLLRVSGHPMYGLPRGNRPQGPPAVFGDGRGRWTPRLLMGSYHPRGLLQDGCDASLPSGTNGAAKATCMDVPL